MPDLIVKPEPGQDVVVIAPDGETFPRAGWRNAARTRHRLPGSTVTAPPPDPEPEPEPPPTMQQVDGNGNRNIAIFQGGREIRVENVHYFDSHPTGTGSIVVQQNAGHLASFEDVLLDQISSTKSGGRWSSDQNDHGFYFGKRPGKGLLRRVEIDASQLTGAGLHIYTAGDGEVEELVLEDVLIHTGDLTRWGIIVNNTRRLVMRNVSVEGRLRTKAFADREGLVNHTGYAVEVNIPQSAVTMENVRYNGRLLSWSDVS